MFACKTNTANSDMLLLHAFVLGVSQNGDLSLTHAAELACMDDILLI